MNACVRWASGIAISCGMLVPATTPAASNGIGPSDPGDETKAVTVEAAAGATECQGSTAESLASRADDGEGDEDEEAVEVEASPDADEDESSGEDEDAAAAVLDEDALEEIPSTIEIPEMLEGLDELRDLDVFAGGDDGEDPPGEMEAIIVTDDEKGGASRVRVPKGSHEIRVEVNGEKVIVRDGEGHVLFDGRKHEERDREPAVERKKAKAKAKAAAPAKPKQREKAEVRLRGLGGGTALTAPRLVLPALPRSRILSLAPRAFRFQLGGLGSTPQAAPRCSPDCGRDCRRDCCRCPGMMGAPAPAPPARIERRIEVVPQRPAQGRRSRRDPV